MKFFNFDSTTSGEKRKVELQELEEMHLNAYDLFMPLMYWLTWAESQSWTVVF